jgi:septal ring factor EnvC (AmiA/AmiB activator)
MANEEILAIIPVLITAVSSIVSGVLVVMSRRSKVEQTNLLNRNNLLYTNKELEETKKDVTEVKGEVKGLLDMLTDMKLKIHVISHDLEGQKKSFSEIKEMVTEMRNQGKDNYERQRRNAEFRHARALLSNDRLRDK